MGSLIMMVVRATLLLCITSIFVHANIQFKHHNNTELAAILQQVHNKCPDISRLYTLSEPSVRGVPLYVLEFSDKPGHHELTEPEMKYVANMHGNEGIAGATVHVRNITRVDRYGHMDNDIGHDIKSASGGDYWRLLSDGEYEIIVATEGYEPQAKLVQVDNGHKEAVRLDFDMV